MARRTRPAPPRGAPRPGTVPAGISSAIRIHISDGDLGHLLPPRRRQSPRFVGSENPACDDHESVDDPARSFDRNVPRTSAGRRRCLRLARHLPNLGIRRKGLVASPTSTTSPTTRSRSTTAPTSTASTWRSGRRATSSRTPPVAGRCMADLIEACEGGHDHDADPVPRPRPLHRGHELDLGMYSRLREHRPDVELLGDGLSEISTR